MKLEPKVRKPNSNLTFYRKSSKPIQLLFDPMSEGLVVEMGAPPLPQNWTSKTHSDPV